MTISMVAPANWPTPTVNNTLSGAQYVINSSNQIVNVNPYDVAYLMGQGFTPTTLISGPATATSGNFASWSGTNGGTLADSGVGAGSFQKSGTGTIAASSGSATLNTSAGTVTSESLSNAVGYTLTLSNTNILVTSVVLFNASNGTSTGVQVESITPASHSVTAVFGFIAHTGTISIPFAVFN